MNTRKILIEKRARRKNRTRARVFGTAESPRLTVFRSNKSIYAQLINDEEGKTLASVSVKSTEKEKEKKNKTQKAEIAGTILAEKALKAGIKKAVFDRGSYAYHGRVKALTEGARKGGLAI